MEEKNIIEEMRKSKEAFAKEIVNENVTAVFTVFLTKEGQVCQRVISNLSAVDQLCFAAAVSKAEKALKNRVIDGILSNNEEAHEKDDLS